jgi:hypothetical protein
MIISTLIFFDASFTKALNYIAKIFSSGIVLFENEKRKYNVSITAIKQKWLLSALLFSNSYRFQVYMLS